MPALIALRVSAARIFTAALGVAAIVWGVYAFPVFWRHAPVEHAAIHVIGGDPFSVEAIAALTPAMKAIEQANDCWPAATRAAAIIRLRLAENSISAAASDKVDGVLKSLRESIRRSLSCSPADPFLWLVLFWVENSTEGFRPAHLDYLRMSYRLGPNEGWIALKRNRFSLSLYEQLPPGLADMAIKEFTNLLNSGFYRETVDIFTGPGWHIRNLLLPRLSMVGRNSRETFARMLYADGYDVDVPDVKNPAPRPWH